MSQWISELNVTNQPNGTGIATEDADSKKVSGDLVVDGDNGTVAAIVIGIVTIVVLLVALAAFFIYRQFVHRNATSMNFDNPVYRKTTEEKCALQKNQLSASRTYPAAPGEETMEPLTSPGTSEYV